MKRFLNNAKRTGTMLGVMAVLATTSVACSNTTNTTSETSSSIEDATINGTITLGDNITTSGTGVTISENTATITAGGTYEITGESKSAQLVVNAKDQDVTVILNGVTINNDSDAPIAVVESKSTTVYLKDGTTNTLTDKKSDEELTDETKRDYDATLYSKSDLIIDGTGTLTVNANYHNGIASKDTLTINNGAINVTATNNAIVGKDNLLINNGDFNIVAGNDGFQCDGISNSTTATDTATDTTSETATADTTSDTTSDSTSDSTDTTDTTDSATADLGNTTIVNGTFKITTEHDAIQSDETLTIENGNFTIVTNEGSTEVLKSSESQQGKEDMDMTKVKPETDEDGNIVLPNGDILDPNNMPEMPNGERPEGMPTGTPPDNAQAPTTATNTTATATTNKDTATTTTNTTTTKTKTTTATTNTNEGGEAVTTTTTEDTESYKGLKATDIVIENGTFNIDSYDDAIHANNSLVVNNGEFTVSSGDDGFHADNNLIINDGTVTITNAYEGIESFTIHLNGGDINILSQDDGINAADPNVTSKAMNPSGSSEEATEGEDPYIEINGANIKTSISGSRSDSVDSNGGIVINSGSLELHGVNNGGDLALDFDMACVVNGGNVLVLGGAGNIADTSKQNTISCSLTEAMSKGETLSILDKDGKEIFKTVLELDTSAVTFSSDKLVSGETYTISSSNKDLKTTEIKASSDSTITTNIDNTMKMPKGGDNASTTTN